MLWFSSRTLTYVWWSAVGFETVFWIEAKTLQRLG